MAWHKQILRKYGKEILSGAVFSIAFSLALLLWILVAGQVYKWEDITPLSEPSIFARAFYSALTFATLGAFLYWIKFYKFLYWLSGSWREFKRAKREVWGALILVMAFIIVPAVFKFVNQVISIGYNIFTFTLFLIPPIGVAVILLILYLHFSQKLSVRDASN